MHLKVKKPQNGKCHFRDAFIKSCLDCNNNDNHSNLKKLPNLCCPLCLLTLKGLLISKLGQN